ncbi:MAG: glycosyltransferase [Candidatus Hodarchaeota archaeon]
MDFLPVSIVIPNYNGEQVLGKNLGSVIEATNAYPRECEIIVVDDASQDNSVAFITENFPTVKVVQHEVNKGFSEAVHSGVQLSTHAIIILLNSDVRPDRNFLAPLIQWFSREDIFSVSPLIVDQQRKPVRVSWVLAKIKRGEIRKRNWDLDDALQMASKGQALKSLYASGGSMAFRKDMFLELRGFLPLYKPFYGEDIDLGIRAWRHGWQTVFEPRSTVIHDHVGTINRFFSYKKIRIIRRRNRFFYLWLHLSNRQLILSHFPWIFYRLPLQLLKMDFVYPIALFKALLRMGEVIKLRDKFKFKNGTLPLEAIFESIRRSTEPISKNKHINKVIFIGKSKKGTGTTRFMFKALKRRVRGAIFINVHRLKKYFFWTDYKKVIQRKIIRAHPDLVLIYSKDLPHQVLKNISSVYKTAMFYGDTVDPFAEEVLRHARLVDYLFVINRTYPGRYESLGVKNALYVTQGCDRDEHRIVPTQNPKWASEVAFIGRPHSDHRIKLLQLIHQHYDLKVWGGEWQDYGLTCLKKRIYPKEFAKICYAAKIFLGSDYDPKLECYFTVRTWYALGCGGFLLTNYLAGMETIFTKGVHLEWYHSPEECLDLIGYYLKHESQRKKIAMDGYEFVHSRRTYDVVMDEIISRIENDAAIK